MKFLLCVAVACVTVAGCAGTTTPPGDKDGGSGLRICPDHPEMCGGTCCGATCVNSDIDPRNCGDCGRTCVNGELCQGGRCGCLPTGAPCGANQTCCNGVGCKSTNSDAFHCGGCGIQCGPGGTCMNGQCRCGAATCGTGQVCCNGTCAATCATDMGAGSPDMAGQSGLCQCSDHCASDPLINWCLGPNCCYSSGLLMLCTIGPCQINMNP
jgi:hypothetical protein